MPIVKYYTAQGCLAQGIAVYIDKSWSRKGQLILKCLFGVFSFFQKNLWLYPLLLSFTLIFYETDIIVFEEKRIERLTDFQC